MLACPFCEQVAVADECGCGSSARVDLHENGAILAFQGDHGFACQGCGATERDLALRLYKRVVGMVFVDRVYSTGGYFWKSAGARNSEST